MKVASLKNRSRMCRQNRGFTLIEILVVIGMIGILAATVLVAVNPLRQFAQARNSQRISNVNAILNAIGNRIADNKGLFNGPGCAMSLSDSPDRMGSASHVGGYDIRPCIVPNYIAEVPVDPSIGMNTCTDVACASGIYDSGYTVQTDSYNRITICAPQSTADGALEPYCVTR